MDLGNIVFFIVVASCIAQLSRQRMTRGWQLVYVAVLMLAAVAWWYAPSYGPWLAGAAYALFIVLPQRLFRAMAEAPDVATLTTAMRWVPLLKVLHPFSDWEALNAISQRQFQLVEGATPALPAAPTREPFTARLRATPVTYAVIAINLLVFAFTSVMGLQMGGVRAIQTYGAFVPRLALAGEWWRAFSSEFLHFGIAHVAFNMLALNNLGRPLEERIGGPRFAAIYLLGGAMAAGGILLLATQGLQSMNQIYAGASASIFGVVGAQLFQAVIARRAAGSQRATLEIQNIIWLVLMQTVFDFSVPGISFAGHMLGFASGFVLCAVVQVVWKTDD